MIRILVVLIFSMCSAYAAQLKFEIATTVVKQGSLVNAVAILDGDSVQQIELQKLKGTSFVDTIYLYQVSPLIKKPNNNFEVDVKIIFLKVPKEQSLRHKLGENEIVVTWSNLEVQPTEAVKELLFGQFEIPSRSRLLLWAGILLLVLVLVFVVFKIQQKLKIKKTINLRKRDIKNFVISGQDYESVVRIWQRKEIVLSEFPLLESHFKEFEKVLFKYQFKLSQTEVEKQAVMKAYSDFVSNSKGGFGGI